MDKWCESQCVSVGTVGEEGVHAYVHMGVSLVSVHVPQQTWGVLGVSVACWLHGKTP